MPIYEYICNRCGHISEAWQKFSDPALRTCEVCGGPVKKIISQNAFHLKGSGWYLTDYASKSKSSEDKPAKKEGKEERTNVEGKGASNKGPSKDT